MTHRFMRDVHLVTWQDWEDGPWCWLLRHLERPDVQVGPAPRTEDAPCTGRSTFNRAQPLGP